VLNAIRDMPLVDIKQVICGELRLNYNDIKVDITWRYLVGEHQYFLIPIACDVSFGTMIEWKEYLECELKER